MRINNKKVYSTEEFKKLIKENEIGVMILTYELKSKDKYFKYYVHSSYPLTNKQIDNNEYGNFFTLNCNDLRKMMNETGSIFYENKKISDIFKQNIAEHNIKVNNQDDFYHGYWAGIYVLLRRLLLEDTLTPDFNDLKSGAILPFEEDVIKQ